MQKGQKFSYKYCQTDDFFKQICAYNLQKYKNFLHRKSFAKL